MSSMQTPSRSKHAREAWTKATATLMDINEGANFARKVLEMFEIVVELLNKILIFPTKFATQKLDPITKEELERVIQRVEEEVHKQWPERSKANEDSFKFSAQIHNPPERCVVSCLLDTGADDNWISVTALKRAKLLNHAKPMTGREKFMGFDGKTIQVTQEITIERYTSAAAIRKTRSYVLKNLVGNQVDIIVGREDIRRYNLVVFRSATPALFKVKCDPEEEESALRKAEDQKEITRILAEQNAAKQIGRLQRKLEVPRAGNNLAEQSSSSCSTNTPEPPTRRPPPPPAKKSASVSAKYSASSIRVQERDRTQSSPGVIVHAPENTSPSPAPSPSVQPPQTHSRSSSVGSLSWLSSRYNLTADATSTPGTPQGSESSFRRWIADLRRQSNADLDQEQQAGASDRGSSPKLSSPR